MHVPIIILYIIYIHYFIVSLVFKYTIQMRNVLCHTVFVQLVIRNADVVFHYVSRVILYVSNLYFMAKLMIKKYNNMEILGWQLSDCVF